MSYLIYDKDGDLLEVLDFKTPQAAQAYQHLNPSHWVEATDPVLEDILLSDIEDEEFNITEEVDLEW